MILSPTLATNGKLLPMVMVAIFLGALPAASARASHGPLVVVIESPSGSFDPARLRARLAESLGRPVVSLMAADTVHGLTVLTIVVSLDGRRARMHIQGAGGGSGWQEIALEGAGQEAEARITSSVTAAIRNLNQWQVTSDVINPFLPWPRERDNDSQTHPFRLAPDVLNPWSEPDGPMAEEGGHLSVPSPRSPLDRRPRGR